MIPNPAREIAEIHVVGGDEAEYQVELYDLTGRQVGMIFIPQGSNSDSLDVKALQPGIYIVSLSQNGILIGERKLVVTR